MNEKPRNHLDVRHRLDKHGNRYGKVIEFAVSELRAIELLENLCQDLKQYQLVRPDAAVGGEEMEYWVKKGTAFKDNRSRGPYVILSPTNFFLRQYYIIKPLLNLLQLVPPFPEYSSSK